MLPIDRLLLKNAIEAMLIFGVVAVSCASAVAMMWLRSRSRRGNLSPELAKRLDEIAGSIERIDASVEAIAVEVERVSEAQRFTARLLAERPAPQAIGERARQIGSTTPH